MKNVIGIVVVAVAGSASAQVLDGQNLAADAAALGLDLLAVQDTPTFFGNAGGGGQDSAGGSELNAAWGGISGGNLNLSISGNLEANFNKMWIFFDSGAGGFNTLTGGGFSDGGFNEINNLGVTFDAGFNADHGIRIEVGNTFLGINQFDLVDNTAGSIWSAGGPGDLPLVNSAGGFGTTFGWDNSNTAGVDGGSAAGALSADSGWEFSIDLAAFFSDASLSEIKASVFISNGDGGFLSNQVLGGIGGGGNIGDLPAADFSAIAGDQFFTIVPSPATGLVAVAGLAGLRRRR